MLNVNNLADGNQTVLERQRFDRLFNALRIPPATLAAMVDWVDSDSIEEPGGAEDSWYGRMAQPGLAANMPAVRIDELAAVRGVNPTVLAAMTRFVTALPDATPLNVNTAPAELLAASIDGVEPAALATLLASRAQQPFQNIGDFRARLPQGASPIGPRFDVHGEEPLFPRVGPRAPGRHRGAGTRADRSRRFSVAARRLANDRIAIAPPSISYTAPMLRVFLAAAPDRDRTNPWVRYGADGRVTGSGNDAPGRWPADAALEVVLAAAPVRPGRRRPAADAAESAAPGRAVCAGRPDGRRRRRGRDRRRAGGKTDDCRDRIACADRQRGHS
jgi:hypothetical protein